MALTGPESPIRNDPDSVCPMAEHDDVTPPITSPVETEYRIEHDTMGEVRVPKDAKYQAQTQRAVENFPISGRALDRTQVRARP